ncbi:MAG TPA: DRTGG domain-containing protein [Bacteroidales bacterium]|nr:DRTGG domain-containing protein [Bacteroidales bacterium]
MKVSDVIARLGLTILNSPRSLEAEVTGGYVSDLLSDVMGNAREGQVWITLQTHKNILAVASLKELSAIILVRGNKPDAETLRKSNEENIPLLGTEYDAFEITGQLYNLLKRA